MGRGTLYLMLAHLVYLTSSYLIHFWLGQYLGPETYGVYGVILGLMTTVSLLLTTGFPQGASKYIAEENASLGRIVAGSRRVQVLFAAVVFGLYIGLAGPIAGLLNDPSLAPYIRISALVVPFYALYALYNEGYLNGLRRFGSQAKAMTANSVAKVVLVFTLVLLGLGVKGAILGYVLGAAVGWLIAWWYLGSVPKGSDGFDWRQFLRFGVPATLFSAMLYLVMSFDLFAVKAFRLGDDAAGWYTAATTIAKVPYFIFGGLASALLPSVSRSTSAKDVELTTSYIRQSTRYMLLLLLPGVLLMSATSEGLVSLVYGQDYIEAAAPLRILVFGLAFLSAFFVFAHVIMGSGKPNVVFGMAACLVAVAVTLNIFLIPRYEMVGAAWATTIASLIGMIASAAYLLVRFRALVAVSSLVKICLASAVIYVVALFIPSSPYLLPLVYVGLFAIYFGLLFLVKEFTGDDIDIFKRMITGRQ